MNGSGRLIFYNGDIFEGRFVNNRAIGQGVYKLVGGG